MLVGININKIEAKRTEDIKDQKISINSTPTIVGMEKKNIENIGEILSVKFYFKSVYEPDAGEIKIYGDVLYKTDKIESILDDWAKEKSVNPDDSVEILNAVFSKCLTRAISIAEDLRLPPPVRFPRVEKGPAPQNDSKEQ